MAGAALSPAWVVYQLNKAAAAISNARPAWRPPKTPNAASCKLRVAVPCERCSSCLLWHQRQATLSLPQLQPVCSSPCARCEHLLLQHLLLPFLLLVHSRICRHGALFNDTIRATPTHAKRTESEKCAQRLPLLQCCLTDAPATEIGAKMSPGCTPWICIDHRSAKCQIGGAFIDPPKKLL